MRPCRVTFLLPIFALSLVSWSQNRHSAESVPYTTNIPVTRVSLYKNGVGFFEHTGHVSGDADVTIDFTTAQLNDVLQSLTAIDLNGGRISGAGYNSTTPLDQQLRNLPLALGENTSAIEFYNVIRGSRISVQSPSGSIAGRLLSAEEKQVAALNPQQPTVARVFLTVVSDSGEVRTLELTAATTVHLLDSDLHTNVNRYLQLLASERSQGLRHLTLQDRGTGTRELRLSYISEVPIWKSTYRIVFTDTGATQADRDATLQGWAVVDNTVGTDWINVRLSLIAGAPQSFIQPLSSPIYSRRPEIPIAQQGQLTPQTHDSALVSANGQTAVAGTLSDQTGATVPNANITVTNANTGATTVARSNADGTFQVPVSAAGQYQLRVEMPGFQPLVRRDVNVAQGSTTEEQLTLSVGSVSSAVEVSADNRSMGGPMPLAKADRNRGLMFAPPPPAPVFNYQQALLNSTVPQTSSTNFDDFFEYKLTEPITIRKNESALVPILQHKIEADRVTLVSFNSNSVPSQPLRALWVKNTTGLTLDRGSFSIVENGNFGGEGLFDPIHANERRLVSYAADEAVHVTTEGGSNTSKVVRITISKGVLQITRGEKQDTTYVIRNAAPEPRVVVIERPVDYRLKLSDESKPEETTASAYRWRVPVSSNETVRFHVGGKLDNVTTYSLTQADDNQFALFVTLSDQNPALLRALQPILEARRHVADAEAAVDQANARIEALKAEEERQRANITALKDADRNSRDRFVKDLNATEDSIKAAQAELVARRAALEAAKAELRSRIEQLQMDETI